MPEIKIRKAREGDSVKEITPLICRSDPTLYRDLFKTHIIAEEILGVLLCTKESIFYRDNYYVAMYKNDIVGLSAAHEIGSFWDPAYIVEAYQNIGVSLPECFDEISQYYSNLFLSSNERVILRNLSTKIGCERRGVATRLIKKTIEDYNDKVLEFSVLKNNTEAIKLYESLGFRKENIVEEYGGCKKQNVICYRMVRP